MWPTYFWVVQTFNIRRATYSCHHSIALKKTPQWNKICHSAGNRWICLDEYFLPDYGVKREGFVFIIFRIMRQKLVFIKKYFSQNNDTFSFLYWTVDGLKMRYAVLNCNHGKNIMSCYSWSLYVIIIVVLSKTYRDTYRIHVFFTCFVPTINFYDWTFNKF